MHWPVNVNKMNKGGKVITQILVVMVAVVFVSALILTLIKTDVIKLSEQEPQPVLNAEFIPFAKAGSLVIKEFKFCSFVDENYNCIGETDGFIPGEVHFVFIVETTPVNGEIILLENYQIKGPNGDILLQAESKDNFYFDFKSKKNTESITVKDFFTMFETNEIGEYTLDLFVENQLVGKKATLSRKFYIEPEMYAKPHTEEDER